MAEPGLQGSAEHQWLTDRAAVPQPRPVCHITEKHKVQMHRSSEPLPTQRPRRALEQDQAMRRCLVAAVERQASYCKVVGETKAITVQIMGLEITKGRQV